MEYTRGISRTTRSNIKSNGRDLEEYESSEVAVAHGLLCLGDDDGRKWFDLVTSKDNCGNQRGVGRRGVLATY